MIKWNVQDNLGKLMNKVVHIFLWQILVFLQEEGHSEMNFSLTVLMLLRLLMLSIV